MHHVQKFHSLISRKTKSIFRTKWNVKGTESDSTIIFVVVELGYVHVDIKNLLSYMYIHAPQCFSSQPDFP